MAAISIPPSPHAIGNMAARRAPLSNLPNASNSPLRPLPANKRPRSQSRAGSEVSHGYQPPNKRQIIEAEDLAPCTPSKRTVYATEARGASRKLDNTFEKRVPNAKDRALNGRTIRQEKAEADETVRQWQKHYRKAFPEYVFYFESIADDVRRYLSRSISQLGAREVKFFSKDVTHVVTARKNLAEHEAGIRVGVGPDSVASGTSTMHHEGTQAGTINPLLLERSTNHNNVLTRPKQFDNSLGTRLANVARDTDNRKHSGAVDVLRRAKELGIKIWHLDKFNRILAVIFDENHPPHGQLTRNTMSNMPQASRTLKHTDLSQMIKNEQLHGPADRESMLTTDLIMLKGPHIYVRCMNEKHKPIMVRDYPRVQNREDAEWPQFRSASMGKCPFIEDDNVQRRTVDKGKPKGASRIARTKDAGQLAPPPRSMTSKALQMQPPQQAGRKRTFEETDLSVSAATQPLQQQLPPPAVVHPISSKQGDATAMPVPLFGGEPMASGMQASNITSAIRSQMISSTAAAPGAKAGTSKEIHGLQRKVLERNSGPTLVELTSNNRVRSVSVAANSNVRLAKQRAQEKLGHRLIDIHENATLSEQDETDQKTQNVGKRNALKSKKSKRDCKPGYCENCKEKFSDFEEHITTKKHRKFATTNENWKELDALLSTLTRPLLEDYREPN